MSNLKLAGVSKTYPSGKPALFDVNFSASDGEFIAIIGGAASGKSTILRIIAGLEEASEGDIYIGDKLMNDVKTKDRDVAMVFSGNTLYPNMNVAENMAFGLKMRNVPTAVAMESVKLVAEMLGLSDVLYRKPKTLTSAQRLLATYGRAIVREPRVYLFDDPLSGLDEKLRAQMCSVLVNLQARVKGTFIYATKNVAEAMSMATRVVVLKDGFVQQTDTPRNLYDYPANEYVAFYVGSPTINFVRRATVERDESGVYALASGVKFPLPENIVSRWGNIEEYVGSGREVTLGLRPEDLRFGGENAEYPCTVLGADSIYEGVAEVELAKGLTLSVFMTKPEKGKAGKLQADLKRLYVFDGKTGLTLLARDGGYEPDEKNGEADFVPLTPDEMQEQIAQRTPVEQPKKKRR
mgnify:FL=1